MLSSQKRLFFIFFLVNVKTALFEMKGAVFIKS